MIHYLNLRVIMKKQVGVEKKRRMGRPPIEYKKEYCQIVIDRMAEGKSFESCGAVIGVCRVTLYNWSNKYPDFLNAWQLGKVLALKWWEDLQQRGAAGECPGFNSAAAKHAMATRFREYGYGEQVEQSIHHSGRIQMPAVTFVVSNDDESNQD